MEIILTVLITLGVLALIGSVVGVMRLNRRVNDLEVARMDIDDDMFRVRKELEDDIEHIHREMLNDKDVYIRNLDRRLDNVWSEIHKLSDKNKALIIQKLTDIDQYLIKGCDEYIQYYNLIYFIINIQK